MAYSSHPTLLSLDRFAKILGLNPAHFNQGVSSTIFPVSSNRCQDLWPQYAWQYAEHVGREEIGEAISVAEMDIASQLKYWPAPYYVAQEVHRYPKHHRPDVWRRSWSNSRGGPISIQTNFGKIISGGTRATTLIGTATTAGGTLVYDFATLTATITLPTTLTDECELHLFYASQSGLPEWEIRPLSSKTITGGNVVITVPTFQLILPSLYEAYPTASGFAGIDITASGNHVTSVEVRRVYTDTTTAFATLYWEPLHPAGINTVPFTSAFCTVCGGSGCAACVLTSEDGCFHIKDAELGTVVPTPASYDADSAAWSVSAITECRDPDTVKVSYLSGQYSNRYLSGLSCDPLADNWARAITYLATARLERPFCQCGSQNKAVIRAQTDLAFTGGDSSYNMPPSLMDNPFGTRWGEVFAWREIYRTGDRVLGGGTF